MRRHDPTPTEDRRPPVRSRPGRVAHMGRGHASILTARRTRTHGQVVCDRSRRGSRRADHGCAVTGSPDDGTAVARLWYSRVLHLPARGDRWVRHPERRRDARPNADVGGVVPAVVLRRGRHPGAIARSRRVCSGKSSDLRRAVRAIDRCRAVDLAYTLWGTGRRGPCRSDTDDALTRIGSEPVRFGDRRRFPLLGPAHRDRSVARGTSALHSNIGRDRRGVGRPRSPHRTAVDAGRLRGDPRDRAGPLPRSPQALPIVDARAGGTDDLDRRERALGLVCGHTAVRLPHPGGHPHRIDDPRHARQNHLARTLGIRDPRLERHRSADPRPAAVAGVGRSAHGSCVARRIAPPPRCPTRLRSALGVLSDGLHDSREHTAQLGGTLHTATARRSRVCCVARAAHSTRHDGDAPSPTIPRPGLRADRGDVVPSGAPSIHGRRIGQLRTELARLASPNERMDARVRGMLQRPRSLRSSCRAAALAHAVNRPLRPRP